MFIKWRSFGNGGSGSSLVRGEIFFIFGFGYWVIRNLNGKEGCFGSLFYRRILLLYFEVELNLLSLC